MTDLEKAMEEYAERFGEGFPMMMARGMEDADIVADINECIQKGVEYYELLDQDATY